MAGKDSTRKGGVKKVDVSKKRARAPKRVIKTPIQSDVQRLKKFKEAVKKVL
jgi:hypothetical protein